MESGVISLANRFVLFIASLMPKTLLNHAVYELTYIVFDVISLMW